jgi:hypothetical protein
MSTTSDTARERHRFRAGDRVVVRSREEILSTLDAEGTLAGLPFMPEMLHWCGKSFRVERRAEKTCVGVTVPVHPNRRFVGDDVVTLEGPRCDGGAHDRCDRGCKIFWKEAWLRPLKPVEAGATADGRGEDPDQDFDLIAGLKTKSGEDHYFCQSTELFAATEGFPGNKRVWRFRIMVREVRNGDRSAPELIRLSALWFSQMVSRKLRGDAWLRGPNDRGPAGSLGLNPGDTVRIKTREEIEATLDQRRGNRGLVICPEMLRLCGSTAEVERRVEQIILEETGKMKEIRNTVALKNVRSPGKSAVLPELGCLCANEIGDCPRLEQMYWREIWLERTGDSPDGTQEAVPDQIRPPRRRRTGANPRV